MTKIRIAKFAGVAAGATLLLGSFVPMVGAQTVSELQAQINALMAQLASMQSTPVGSAVQFNTNLTVGSRGADVTALQQFLVSKGFLQMPAGVAYGYFGSVTKAAVARWQAANGIYPAVGYFGPISRAAIATQMGTVSTPGAPCPAGYVCSPTSPTPVLCPAGYTCSPTGGTVTGTTGTVNGVITTPGVEATLTASLNPSPASGTKLYEGDSRKAVLGIKLETQTGDVRVERLKLKLDCVAGGCSDQDIYNKIATRIYVMDGSSVLASMDLNGSTVVKEGSDYYVTITGFGFVVPKDQTRVLTVALDANSNWDTAFDTDTWSLTVPVDGVRGIDGAGINQYSPSSIFARNFTTEGSLSDAATLAISLNSGSPITNQVIAEQGTGNNEYDALEILRADFRAEKDTVLVTDLVVTINRPVTTGTATATTAYLYDGSSLVGSATVVGTTANLMTATFNDIDWTVPQNTTRVLTVKLDIDTASVNPATFNAVITAAGVTDENSTGGSVADSGSATSRTITVRNVGPEVSLVSKSITTNGVPQTSASPSSTSTLTATFNVRVRAMGGDLLLGTVASGSPVVSSSTASFKVYRNGSFDAAAGSSATSTSYSIPNGCTVGVNNSCTLSEGAEVVIPVTFQILGRNTAGVALTSGLYSVGFEGITWTAAGAAAQTTTFMAGETDWRTADVSFP